MRNTRDTDEGHTLLRVVAELLQKGFVFSENFPLLLFPLWRGKRTLQIYCKNAELRKAGYW